VLSTLERIEIEGHGLDAALVLGEIEPQSPTAFRSTGEFVVHIREAAERMLAILTHLFDASAIDAGKLALRPGRIDLGDVARLVVENNGPAASRKSQVLELVLDGRPRPRAASPPRVSGCRLRSSSRS
jgi:signal transduction histidine kinase